MLNSGIAICSSGTKKSVRKALKKKRKNTDSVLGTSSTVNGLSVTEIDSGSEATTAGLQVKIIGITKDPENDDASSANANWYVMFNEHVKLGTGITGT